jgi:hypothetical protein
MVHVVQIPSPIVFGGIQAVLVQIIQAAELKTRHGHFAGANF